MISVILSSLGILLISVIIGWLACYFVYFLFFNVFHSDEKNYEPYENLFLNKYNKRRRMR